jgi:hypothetical protein
MTPVTVTGDNLEKRLEQLKREISIRGVEHHISVLKNVSDLPAELHSPAVAALADSEAIQAIFFFPPQIQRGWHYVPKQALLFTSTGVIHLLASILPDQAPQVTQLQGDGLLYVRTSLLLLHGYLEIVAQGHGTPVRLGMEFNTVGWDPLSGPVRQLLQAGMANPAAATAKSSYSPPAQPALEKLPLKFANGTRIHGLLPGEELKDLVFQPGTRKRWLLVFRRAVTANTLLLLTNHFVVVIQEELEVAQGWIIAHIPRENITCMRSQPRGPWNELSIQLEREGQCADYHLLLKSEATEAWRRLWIRHGGQWQTLPDEAGCGN